MLSSIDNEHVPTIKTQTPNQKTTNIRICNTQVILDKNKFFFKLIFYVFLKTIVGTEA